MWLLAGATSHASAQVTARNFQELGLKVRPVTPCTSPTTGESKEQEAQILELTPSLLAVSVGGARRDLSESNLSRIRQCLPDSRKNGALIGFLVGASGSTAGAVSIASPSGSCKGGCIAANAAYGGGLGALVGLGIDSLVQGRKDIYVRADSRPSRGVEVRPLASSAVRGLRVSLRF
jgi:hypothetical protein